jgi:putative FmdB family regulatory protein
MPTYELHCVDCGHRFDRFLMRWLKESDKVCPECGSTHVETGVGGGFAPKWPASGGGCAPQGGFG